MRLLYAAVGESVPKPTRAMLLLDVLKRNVYIGLL